MVSASAPYSVFSCSSFGDRMAVPVSVPPSKRWHNNLKPYRRYVGRRPAVMKSRSDCHKFKIIIKLFETGPNHLFVFLLKTLKYIEYNFTLQCKIVLKHKQNTFGQLE